jgi:hypothetical protein
VGKANIESSIYAMESSDLDHPASKWISEVDKLVTSPAISRLLETERKFNDICISYEIGHPTI